MTLATYTFPKSLGGGTITIGPLTLDNQLDASKATGDMSQTSLVLEYAKRSLVHEGTDEVEFEKWWNGLGGKQRELILKAYMKINVPEESEVAEAIGTIQRLMLNDQERHTATIRGRVYGFAPVTVSTLTLLARKSHDNVVVLNLEACIASLDSVAGSPITDKRGFVAALDPQERQIVLRVYMAVNSTSEQEENDFFASENPDSGTGSPTSAGTPISPSERSSA